MAQGSVPAHSALRTRLIASGAAPASAKLSALRGVLKAAWRLGQMDTDAYQRAADGRNLKSSRLPAGCALEMDEVGALFRVCADGTPACARNVALLALLFGAGLRRSAAAAVQVTDLETDPLDGAAAVRVVGKGNRERQIWTTRGGAAALANWMVIRGRVNGPLLCRGQPSWPG